MASYSLDQKAVTHARELIEARQYVLESEWGEVQPDAEDENAYRAAEWRHKEIELAAHELLQLLDERMAG